MNSRRIDAIQGLRGVAALLVVIAHSFLTLVEKANYDASISHQAGELGELGVKIFFVISGFIMTVTMYEQFDTRGSPSAFLWKRLMRIVPLYWIATLICATKLTIAGEPPKPIDMVLSLGFVPYQDSNGTYYPVYGLGWTLNYEMFFYALFALALLLPRRFGLPALIVTLLLIALAGILGLTENCTGRACDILHFYRRPIILYFAAGILLGVARIYLERGNKLPTIPVQHAVAVSIVLVGICGVYASIAAIFLPILACGLATALCGLSKNNDNDSALAKLILALGDASYSIYLTHSFLIGPAGRLWYLLFGAQGLLPFTIAMLVGSSILGLFTYRYVEKPLLNVLRRQMQYRTASVQS